MTSKSPAKPVLFSGIQPSGRLHIGNYLGALKNFVDLQNSEKYQCYFCVVDLHSITEDFNPEEKRKQILNLTADFLASGIDPKQSVLMLQSQVPAHSELSWVLSTVTPMGELNRMTQFKDKGKVKDLHDLASELTKIILNRKDLASREMQLIKFAGDLDLYDANQSTANVGLFTYPVLMAADILLYDTAVVPVGNDQLQHLEITRTLARKFNKRFGQTFIEPKDLLTKTPRVMSLKDPKKKMSKSQPDGCLFLDDTPEDVARKIARAVTDSESNIFYQPEKRPGLANLLDIYAALTHMEPKTVAEEFGGKTYAQLKASLAEVFVNHFADFRAAKAKLLAKPEDLAKVLTAGSAQAAKIASKKMDEVKQKIGLAI
jgi:tryptophanyl-tRNA synthetase